jgi:hypothetical protein
MPSSARLAEIGDGDISTTGHLLLDSVIKSIKEAEAINRLTGTQKKTLVLDAVMDELALPRSLRVLLPYLIEAFISIDKGEIKLGKKKESQGLYRYCFSKRSGK